MDLETLKALGIVLGSLLAAMGGPKVVDIVREKLGYDAKAESRILDDQIDQRREWQKRVEMLEQREQKLRAALDDQRAQTAALALQHQDCIRDTAELKRQIEQLKARIAELEARS